MPEPEPHPLDSDDALTKCTSVGLLAGLCLEYANSIQHIVSGARERRDGNFHKDASALIVITAAYQVVRTARKISCLMPEYKQFVDLMNKELNTFTTVHSDLKKARDVITHVDEYISSDGRDSNHWFDITNRIGDDYWIARIGNKLDIDIIKLAADISKLADTAYKVSSTFMSIEIQMEKPVAIVNLLASRGLYADIHINGEMMDININRVGKRYLATEQE